MIATRIQRFLKNKLLSNYLQKFWLLWHGLKRKKILSTNLVGPLWTGYNIIAKLKNCKKKEVKVCLPQSQRLWALGDIGVDCTRSWRIRLLRGHSVRLAVDSAETVSVWSFTVRKRQGLLAGEVHYLFPFLKKGISGEKDTFEQMRKMRFSVVFSFF